MTLLGQALSALQGKFDEKNAGALFNELKCFLPGVGEPPAYTEVASRLGQSEDVVKMAVSRLKKEFGQALKAEVRRTVSSTAELNEELRHLLALLGE